MKYINYIHTFVLILFLLGVASGTPPDPTTLANTSDSSWVNHTWSPGISDTGIFGTYLVSGEYTGTFNGYWWNGAGWDSNSLIKTGLVDTGTYSGETIFRINGVRYLLAGRVDGTLDGYNWTGSTWQPDTSIETGLWDMGSTSKPCAFEISGVNYLIVGNISGLFTGYNWTGSTWQNDSAIVGGLVDVGERSTPAVFEIDSTYYLISGKRYGTFDGYNWTGSAWQSDSAIIGGLADTGDTPSPTTFVLNSIYYTIVGTVGGTFAGYNWTGSAWQSDSAIVGGLGDVGTYSTPHVFTAISETDSYHVSINTTWHNTTTTTYHNNTPIPSGNWSNITVWAWNSTSSELSSGSVSENVQTSASAAPSITSYAPTGTIWPEVYDSQLFNVTVDQVTQCRWYVNGTLKQTNASLSLTHAYTNSSLVGGGCNVTAVCNNTNGSDTQTWLFEVGADSISYVVLKDQPTNQTLITEIDVTRIGSNIIDWGIWQNHTYSGWEYCFRFTNGTEIMSQTATSNNESLWFNGTSLLPIGVYFLNATSDTNTITLYANEYALVNNWTTEQTYQAVAANISNDVCYSYYNHTSGLWEAYRAGYTYNANAVIPTNNSVFVFVDAETTISAEPHTGGITITQDTWFYGMLPGSSAKTLAEIETKMDSDGRDVWALYGFDNATQAYTTAGSHSVAAGTGYAVYCNVTGEYIP